MLTIVLTPLRLGLWALAMLPALLAAAPQLTLDTAWQTLDSSTLALRSKAYLVVDERGWVVAQREADQPRPIASITKVMTAMTLLDAAVSLDTDITITKADRDLLKLTGSRLEYGATLSRGELLDLALMASENRAAAALARTFPGGTERFVAKMNEKAQALGMADSHFVEPTGLSAENVATPRDLITMLRAAADYPRIREASTRLQHSVRPYAKRGSLRFGNTNRLIKKEDWRVRLSKTGYINEAGRCLLMRADIGGRTLDIVFLDAFGKLTPLGDANRLRKWIERELSGRTASADAGGSSSG